MEIWMLWLIAAVVLLLIELITADLLFASLGVAALGATGTAALGADMVTQAAVFAVVAALSLWLLRPIALKHLKRQAKGQATNVNRLIGATGVALAEITQYKGQAKIDGEVWSARTQNGTIAINTPVQVSEIDGATAIVSASPNTAKQ